MYLKHTKGMATFLVLLYISIFVVVITLFTRSSMLMVQSCSEYALLKRHQLITEALITYGIFMTEELIDDYSFKRDHTIIIRDWPNFIQLQQHGVIIITIESLITLRASLYEKNILVYVIECSIIKNKEKKFIINNWLEQGSIF